MFFTYCHLFFFKVQYLVHFYSTFDYLYLGISKMDSLNFVSDNTIKAFENSIEKFTSMLLLLRNIYLHAIVVEKNLSPCCCCRKKFISMLLLLRKIHLHAIVVEKNSAPCHCCWEKFMSMLLLLRKFISMLLLLRKTAKWKILTWFPLPLERLENKEKGNTGGGCFLAMLIWSAWKLSFSIVKAVAGVAVNSQ